MLYWKQYFYSNFFLLFFLKKKKKKLCSFFISQSFTDAHHHSQCCRVPIHYHHTSWGPQFLYTSWGPQFLWIGHSMTKNQSPAINLAIACPSTTTHIQYHPPHVSFQKEIMKEKCKIERQRESFKIIIITSCKPVRCTKKLLKIKSKLILIPFTSFDEYVFFSFSFL